MSVFDLFRGFFGVPGGHYRGEGRRDPFFDAMTHDDDEDNDDDYEYGDRFYCDGYQQGDQQDPIDDAWRFGFSFGPNGMRIEEPPVFGQVFREMEEIFSQLGRWEGQLGAGHSGVPSIEAPLPEDRPGRGGGPSGNPLRDFMLKSPGGRPTGPPAGPSGEPRHDETPPCGRTPHFPNSPFQDWTPFSKFHDALRARPHRDAEEERKQDGDLDSAVSSGGLDQILTRPPAVPSQPRGSSLFQSVMVTKVVQPDGTVEERRTVRDGRGNEETTVTRSGVPGNLVGPQDQAGRLLPGDQDLFSDLRDDHSFFSKFFGGFK